MSTMRVITITASITKHIITTFIITTERSQSRRPLLQRPAAERGVEGIAMWVLAEAGHSPFRNRPLTKGPGNGPELIANIS